jgi:formylglycine-generating enzyme required for sulfatase activity
MPRPPISGPIASERDIIAHTVNTGHIEQHTHLTLNIITDRLDRLASLLAQPGSTVRLSASGEVEVAAADQASLALPHNLLEAWQLLPQAADAPLALRRRAYAAWLVTQRPDKPVQEVAAREHYVPLAGWVSLQDLPLTTLRFAERRWTDTGPQRRLERIPLADVSQAVDQHPAFVLLGPPGCGKSTVLRRLALETARAFLAGQDARLPVRVNLAGYAGPSPLAFIAQRWAAEGLPGDFLSLVRAGEIFLLADGFNEMPFLAAESDRQRRANDWRRFFEDHFNDPHNRSRAILASRDQADYTQPLDLPRVEINPLSDDQIAAFLHAYLGEQADEALAAIQRLELITHARNPYQLSVLAALYDPQRGDLPPNRGRLFAEYAAWLIQREERANHPHWIRAEVQQAALAHLGYAMQAQGESTLLSKPRLLDLLPQTVHLQHETVPLDKEALFDLACRAGLFVADQAAAMPQAYRFSHQLIQEHYAAQQMLGAWQAGEPESAAWWHAVRTHRDMPPAEAGEWDPLPPPPPTGWEQITILAAGMTDQADAFVGAVVTLHPALAGRCVSEGSARISPATRSAVQQALLADLGNPEVHRRVRLQAGRVLGAVGDPRFTPRVVGGIEVILPDLVPVSGGTATIGSARWPWDRLADTDERPRHRVEVAAFYLARLPVTNAEYACFMQAGGYETERYWTADGWRWRHGKGESSGSVEEYLEYHQYFTQNPDAIEKWLEEGRISPDTADTWRALIRLSAEEVRQLFLQQFPMQPHERPQYWNDPAYNAPNQPVVGITRYEAMAYCAWLHEHIAASGQPLSLVGEAANALLASGEWNIRLPTEPEWEWAAGGPRHKRYPWGKAFDAERANTLEGRVLGTSPVGAYPAGAAACGALDMSGNVWEWTHSLYQAYPYRVNDGREDPGASGRRVLRGGSWGDGQWNARVSCRRRSHPATFSVDLGCRVVLAPVFPDSDC